MIYIGATTPYIYSTLDYIFQGCTNFRLLFTPHPSFSTWIYQLDPTCVAPWRL